MRGVREPLSTHGRIRVSMALSGVPKPDGYRRSFDSGNVPACIAYAVDRISGSRDKP